MHFGSVSPKDNSRATDWTTLIDPRPNGWKVTIDEFDEPKKDCYYFKYHIPGLSGFQPTTDNRYAEGWKNGLGRWNGLQHGVANIDEFGELPMNQQVSTSSVTYCDAYAERDTNYCEEWDRCIITCCGCFISCCDTCERYRKESYCKTPTIVQSYSPGAETWGSGVICGSQTLNVNYSNQHYDNIVDSTQADTINHTYMYSIMGNFGSSKFPDSLLPGSSNIHELQHACHHLVIEVLTNPKPVMPPTVSGGIGQFPEKCIHTNICVVHWCENETLKNRITLSGGSEDEFRFKAYQYRVAKSVVNPVDGTGTLTREYCLKDKSTSQSCPSSISFEVSQAVPLKSDLGTRKKLTIENKKTKQSKNCFNFPYSYNWDNYMQRSSGPSDHNLFFSGNAYIPPANIEFRSQLLQLAVSLEGSAVATYQMTNGNSVYPTRRIYVQVCSSTVNSELILPYTYNHASIVNDSINKGGVAISDDGSTVALGLGRRNVYIYSKDLTDGTWPAENVSYVVNTENQGTVDHVYLSSSGFFMAVIIGGDNLYVFKKDYRGTGYIRSLHMNKSSGMWEKTSVEAMESGVVSIGAMDNTGNVDTFEVSGMPDHDCLFM